MENSYFAQEHSADQLNYNKQKKKSISIPTFIFSLIMVACITIIVFLKWNDILWFFGVEEEDITETDTIQFSLGDEVQFSGDIKKDGDMENYTHTYYSSEYDMNFGLKSSKFILDEYTNNIYFEWIIERFYHEMPIVSVTAIYQMEDFESTWSDVQEDENIEKNEKYLPNIWLFFSEDFFQKYILVNEWDWTTLKFKNIETNIISSINYFKCNKWNNSENCDYLNSSYSEASIQKLVDKYWVSYYKDPEVNSWFFSNDSVFWYKIVDEQESVVTDLSRLVTIVNKSFVEKNVKPNISKLCTINYKSIEKIDKSELSYENNNFHYKVEWSDVNWNSISCELKIDPTLDKFAQVVNISENESKWEETTETWDNKEDTNTNETETSTWENKESTYNWDIDVEQFPINLDKKLTFTSSRWHSFIFPSSKIAYQGMNSSENFGQVGVNCFSAMNVVSYDEKDLVETKWNVVIYECNIKNTFDDSDKTLIYKNIGDKHFVIKIVDPAWVEFANNIEINA